MYLALKTLHVLSSTILFGTGVGTAFSMWMVNRSGNRQAMAVVTRHVIKADLYFTTPAVIVQPLSGFALMALGGLPMQFAPLNWLGLSLLLYIVAGACWLPVHSDTSSAGLMVGFPEKTAPRLTMTTSPDSPSQ